MTIDPYDVIFVDTAQRWVAEPLSLTIPDMAWERVEGGEATAGGILRATFLRNGITSVEGVRRTHASAWVDAGTA